MSSVVEPPIAQMRNPCFARKAADFGIPLITNIQLAQRFVEALSKKRVAELQIKSWEDYAPPEQTSIRVSSLPRRDDDVLPAPVASAAA